MRITVIKSEEMRERYRFVSEPLERSGHQVQLIDTGTIPAFVWSLLSLRRAGRRPDAIISMGTGPKALLAFLLTRGGRLPFAVRLGGNPVKDSGARAASAWASRQPRAWARFIIYKISTKLLLATVSHIIVVNSYLATQLRTSTNPSVHVSVIPQFCRDDPVPRSHRIRRVPVLLSAANLNYKVKADGIVWLVDRLAEYVRETHRELVFRIAGGGEHLAHVRAHVEGMRLPLGLRVEVLGFVTEMGRQYERADIFMYCSEHDATPNVLLEAKRWGIPLLVNDFAAFHSILVHDASGLFYKDGEDFKRSLGRMLFDETLRERLGFGGYREYKEAFSVEASQQRLEHTLDALVSGHSPNPRPPVGRPAE